jgi:2'-5' RNA ligase
MQRSEIDKYFIAIVFQEPLQSAITELKQEVAQKFNSKGALRSPAHITLQMPFEWSIKKKEKLLISLKTFASLQMPFDIELKDFAFFEPRVVFVDVIKNASLNQLQNGLQASLKKDLQIFERDDKYRGFHPHATIGFRDLKKSAFYEAQTYYGERTFYAKENVRDIALLKHDGKIWEVEERFAFGITSF